MSFWYSFVNFYRIRTLNFLKIPVTRNIGVSERENESIELNSETEEKTRFHLIVIIISAF